MREFVMNDLREDKESVVFCVGAMAHGKVDVSWTDDFISVSQYPLSGVLYRENMQRVGAKTRYRLIPSKQEKKSCSVCNSSRNHKIYT